MEVLRNSREDRFGKFIVAVTAVVVACAVILLVYLAREYEGLLEYGRRDRGTADTMPLASIGMKTGMVTVNREGLLEKIRAALDTKLYAGDRIQTSAGAGARVDFSEDVSFMLEENALMEIQREKKAGEDGRALVELREGSLRVKGSGIGALLAGLKTPNALIEFGRSQVITYSRKKTGRQSEETPGGLFVEALRDYVITAPIIEQDRKRVERLIEKARASCAPGGGGNCDTAARAAWKALSTARLGSGRAGDYDITVSVDSSGKEKISVDRGELTVNAGASKISLTEEDEPLELEKDVPVVPEDEPVDELFIDIQSIGWD